MEEVLRALNRLVELGLIGDYAIGGAVGAAFYIEAMQTEDVDAFVLLPLSGTGQISLTPVYEELVRLGARIDGAYVTFADWPLQILPDGNALVKEAIVRADTVDFAGVLTRVMSAEYLCALALQVGRTKDLLRVRSFVEQGVVDLLQLETLAREYGLNERLGRLTEGKV